MRHFGMKFGFKFLWKPWYRKETGWVTSFSYSGKIKYTDSVIETFFSPRAKFKEGFITWAPLNIILKLCTNVFNNILWTALKMSCRWMAFMQRHSSYLSWQLSRVTLNVRSVFLLEYCSGRTLGGSLSESQLRLSHEENLGTWAELDIWVGKGPAVCGAPPSLLFSWWRIPWRETRAKWSDRLLSIEARVD